MPGLLHRFIAWQMKLSRGFDRLIFREMAKDGNGCYLELVSGLVPNGSTVADVGGGKRPFFSPTEAATRSLTVTGIDIDRDELERAPEGSYARLVVCPLERLNVPPLHDIVIAQSVLEHVRDGRAAIRGCASLLKPGGRLYTFCPNRRAWFALLNRAIPESIKRQILFGIFPEKREKQGFPAFYDGCTPMEMKANMEAAGLTVVRVDYFFVSSYFMFFFPLYLFWRMFTFPLMQLWPSRYCETFIIQAVRT